MQLQVATSSDGGATETDVITSAIAPSHQSPYYGFVWFWMDERGGPVDGSGTTHYLISTVDANNRPHLWQSTDDTLQAWKEIPLPVELTAGANPGFVYDGLRSHKTGNVIISARVFLSPGPDGGTAYYQATYVYNGTTWTPNYLFAGQPTTTIDFTLPLAEGDDGSLFLAASGTRDKAVSSLYKSTDGGTTWATILSPGAGGVFCSLKYFTAMGAGGPGLPALFAFFQGQPWVSKDNGATWSHITSIPTSNALLSNQHSFVARLSDGTYLLNTRADSKIYHSTDATGTSYQPEALPAGFAGVDALVTGDDFAWMVLDNDSKGPYLYKRNTDASYHPSLTGLLTLLATARDAGNYYITGVSSAVFDFYTQSARRAFWGVDSLEVVTQTFFDAVRKAGGGPPAFWGWYVGTKEGNLSQLEVEQVLHKNSCKVLLIYNGTYAKYDGKQRVSTYADGVFHANNAMQYIKEKKLGVPQNKSVWIYLDTEFGGGFPKLPPEFFRGWFDAMLGSLYGGAGGVYGNTIDDAGHNPFFNAPFCSAYNSGISFMQTDAQASCPMKQYFGNPVGRSAVMTSGRAAAAGGTPGTHRLVETMQASESEAMYVLWEITPGPNAVWRAGDWTVRLNVTVPSHFITWNGVEIVHTDQHCNGKERLGSVDGQSVSLIPPGVKSMVVPGIAPTSIPDAGDKVLLLLSFSNSKAQSRSFEYTPDQLIESPFARLGVLVYANQPEPIDHICDPGYRTFGPYPPKPCNAPTVVQQYTIGKPGALGCPVGGHKVDFDLANAGGLASMW